MLIAFLSSLVFFAKTRELAFVNTLSNYLSVKNLLLKIFDKLTSAVPAVGDRLPSTNAFAASLDKFYLSIVVGDVNAVLSSGYTPLLHAASAGSIAAVRILVTHGADANVALCLAAKHGELQAVECLIKEAKASVHHVDASGLSPLMHASANGKVETGRLLIRSGVEVSPKGDGQRALAAASASGSLEMVELLIQSKADVDSRASVSCAAGEERKLAVEWAEEKGHGEVAAVLKRVMKVNADKKEKERKKAEKKRKENKAKKEKSKKERERLEQERLVREEKERERKEQLVQENEEKKKERAKKLKEKKEKERAEKEKKENEKAEKAQKTKEARIAAAEEAKKKVRVRW